MKINSRWIVFVPVVLIALFSGGTKVVAQPQQELTVTGYEIGGNIPPATDQTGAPENPDQYPQCGQTTVANIADEWDSKAFENCPQDQFMLHYQGQVTFDRYASLMLWSDDGAMLRLDGAEIYSQWWDKGCSPFYVEINAGTYNIDVWFYENGGGTCLYLYQLSADGTAWEIVPAEAFANGLSNTQTTIGTTNIQETTTSIFADLSTTTSQEITTTTLAANTTSTTTTSELPSTTTTVLVAVDTTTTLAEPVPPTEPPVTEPPTTTTALVETSVETVPIPQITPPLRNVIPTSTELETTTTTTLPPDALGSDLSAVEAEIVLDTATTPEALGNAIETLISANAPIKAEQVIAILNNPAFEQLPNNQIEQVFKQLDVASLDNTQVEQLTEQLNTAPDNVKTAFENAINIFSGVFNNYVPTGSTIPVHARRTLVAAGTVISFLPAPQPKTRRKK